MSPLFFATPEELRAWFEQHHASLREAWIGFYKKGSGRPSITWPESVDEALCVGWIDGVRRSLGEESYEIRFTPRKPSSTWSAVNIQRMEELQREGRVRPAGRKAFENRSEAKSGIYAYEQEKASLDPAAEQQFRAHGAAWEFFQSQPAWYRKTAIWRIVSAKRAETRQKRLTELIEHSAQKRTIPQLTRTGKPQAQKD